ncbi:MAG TPA: hypothetical protein VMP08_12335 [Anaerolineae bacterium]|nr:hypothetical protein [Anaerolineae bacterium]
MGKRADYCIVGVRLTPDRKQIDTVRMLPDTGSLLMTGLIMARRQIVAGLQRGMTFTTALPDHEQMSYAKGQTVSIVTIAGVDYVRIDANPIEADELGDLPEF